MNRHFANTARLAIETPTPLGNPTAFDSYGTARSVFRRVALAVVLLGFGWAGMASAANLGVNFDNTGATSATGDNVNIGWEFSISSPITITQLGFWDSNANGLNEAHDVAIWSSGGAGDLGSALVTANVPIGTAAPLAPGSQFRMVDVSPTVLAAGNYVIAGRLVELFGEPFKNSAISGEVFGPGVTYIEPRLLGNPSFERPDFSPSGGGLYGPNFTFVPEPSSIVLAGLGLVALGAWGWRRRTARHAGGS